MSGRTEGGNVGRCWRLLLSIGVFALAGLVSDGALAGRDGKYLYVLTCSGCHGVEGLASKEGRVPALAGSIGHFMKAPEARNFLPQAPGIMTSGLNDRDVQALMNWMVPALSGPSLSGGFEPYSLEEIAQARKTKPGDFFMARRMIAKKLKDLGYDVAPY
jgi:mono/diheme cytochrome c family protein